MKSNRLVKLLATGTVSAIALTTAFAEESATTTITTTATDGATSALSTSAVAVDGTGTIVSYKPSLDFITVQTVKDTAPVMYYYTKETTIVDSEGKKVEWSMIKADMPVKYAYVKDGDRMVIRKITLEKPLSFYEKASKPAKSKS